MIEQDIFSSIEYLEPKCPKCGSVLKYGVNTQYDDEAKSHVCLKCGAVLK